MKRRPLARCSAVDAAARLGAKTRERRALLMLLLMLQLPCSRRAHSGLGTMRRCSCLLLLMLPCWSCGWFCCCCCRGGGRAGGPAAAALQLHLLLHLHFEQRPFALVVHASR